MLATAVRHRRGPSRDSVLRYDSCLLDESTLAGANWLFCENRNHPAGEVYVTGTFDNWGKSTKLEQEGDAFVARVELPIEKTLYKVYQILYFLCLLPWKISVIADVSVTLPWCFLGMRCASYHLIFSCKDYFRSSVRQRTPAAEMSILLR